MVSQPAMLLKVSCSVCLVVRCSVLHHSLASLVQHPKRDRSQCITTDLGCGRTPTSLSANSVTLLQAASSADISPPARHTCSECRPWRLWCACMCSMLVVELFPSIRQACTCSDNVQTHRHSCNPTYQKGGNALLLICYQLSPAVFIVCTPGFLNMTVLLPALHGSARER